MRFEPNEDQATFLSVVDQIASGDGTEWTVQPDWGRYQGSATLDATLEEGGFFDCALEDTLGPVAGVAMIYRLARLPVILEVAASTLLRPYLPEDLPRPIAVIEDNPASAIRFLPLAKTVVILGPEKAQAAILAENDVRPVDSLFAYPMGTLAHRPKDLRSLEVDPRKILDSWRIANAAELAGVLKGGCDAVLEHVRERRQFGQALGSFQGIQHRLAASAIRIEAGYWMTLKASQGMDETDASLALGYLQNATTSVVYDFHQFMGAMGLTLEHPLHRWTYRARLLKSALGGANASLRAAANRRWRVA